MKRIAYKMPDGSVGLIVPVINTYPEREQITETQALVRAFKDIPDEAVEAYVLDEKDVPPTTDRQADWRLVGGRIVAAP